MDQSYIGGINPCGRGLIESRMIDDIDIIINEKRTAESGERAQKISDTSANIGRIKSNQR